MKLPPRLQLPWNPSRRGWALLLALCVTLAAVTWPAPVRADAIDRQLAREAAAVMDHLRDMHYQNVGVLKFRVQRAGQAASFNAGPMNASMADRLENALVLADDPAHPIGIIQNAHQVAWERALKSAGKKVPPLSSVEGRRSLLVANYPLVWGERHVLPDALLTGDIVLSKDNRTATIAIKAFDRRAPAEVKQVHHFTMKTDRNFLAECGQPFAISRKLARDPVNADRIAAENAVIVNNNSGNNVVRDPDNPVEFTIVYNGNPVALTEDTANRGTLAFQAPDPKESDEVSFLVRNRTNQPVGLVVAVNGRNTLFQEDIKDKPPAECAMWVLDDTQQYAIRGFYLGEKGENIKKFRVLSDPESQRLMEVNPDTQGVISLYIFAKAGGIPANTVNTPVNPIRNNDTNASVSLPETRNLRRGIAITKTKPRTVAEAQAALARAARPSHARPGAKTARVGNRGLIVEDVTTTTGSALQEVALDYDPQPIVSLVIRYYTPQANVVGEERP